MIPTKQEFVEEYNKIQEDFEKLQYFNETVNGWGWSIFMEGDFLSDHTCESWNEDMDEYIEQRLDNNPEKVYDWIMSYAKQSWMSKVFGRFELEDVKKLATKEELEELKRIEELLVESKL